MKATKIIVLQLTISFSKLQTVNRYSELTIDDVRTLNTFSNNELYQTTQMDLMYGDHLFNN